MLKYFPTCEIRQNTLLPALHVTTDKLQIECATLAVAVRAVRVYIGFRKSGIGYVKCKQ